MLYALDNKVIITEELGDFSKTQLFEIAVEELKNLSKHVYLTNADKKETLFFGLTKKKDKFLLTLSKWGAYEGRDDNDEPIYAKSENTYFMTSAKTLSQVFEGDLETEDGSAYKKTLFYF